MNQLLSTIQTLNLPSTEVLLFGGILVIGILISFGIILTYALPFIKQKIEEGKKISQELKGEANKVRQTIYSKYQEYEGQPLLDKISANIESLDKDNQILKEKAQQVTSSEFVNKQLKEDIEPFALERKTEKTNQAKQIWDTFKAEEQETFQNLATNQDRIDYLNSKGFEGEDVFPGIFTILSQEAVNMNNVLPTTLSGLTPTIPVETTLPKTTSSFNPLAPSAPPQSSYTPPK